LDGIQPQFRHTPPSASRSTIAVRSPSCPARIAATYPPGPDPSTTTSKSAKREPRKATGLALSPPLANAILNSTPSLSHDGRKTKATNEASGREPNACVQRPLIRRRKRDASIPERLVMGVQRATPLWQGDWGMCPQLTTPSKAGGWAQFKFFVSNVRKRSTR
jgi:hypothetical protein